MTGKTHVLGGIALGAIYSLNKNLGINETIAVTVISAAGSLLPDIDSSNSKFGRTIPFVSIPISKIFGHRGLFHWPIFYLILGALALNFYGQYSFYIYPTLIGIFSHLILDILNPLGIPLLSPGSKKVNLLNIYTGSMSENVLAVIMVIATITVIANNYLNIV
ncbi:MAG TPA: hypothetical protein DCS12_01285 [Clostridiales bacterium]|jgi:inner membrane protein|nr:hypothetical protein [Clostridiales bacterium]